MALVAWLFLFHINLEAIAYTETLYKNSDATPQTWYSHSNYYTIRGGYAEVAANDFVYKVRIETNRTKAAYYGAESFIVVYLEHPALSSSKSRCKFWFVPDPSVTSGSLGLRCSRFT